MFSIRLHVLWIVSYLWGSATSNVLSTPFPSSTGNITSSSYSWPAVTPPPVPTPRLFPLPTNVTDLPHGANKCWESHASYSVANGWLSDQAQFRFTPLVPPEINSYTSTHPANCSATPIGLTTLCDGWPRASREEINCATITVPSVSTRSAAYVTIFPSWTTGLTLPPSPACTVAEDFGPECTKLAEVYTSLKNSYITSASRTEILWSYSADKSLMSEAPPCTMMLSQSTSSARPTCSLLDFHYEAYYWPTPTPTGIDFCKNSTNSTLPTTVTPLPGTLRTTVVSGLTLTSPSIYHFFHDVSFETLIGVPSRIADPGPPTLWATTTIANQAPLTVAQLPNDIISQTVRCGGSGSKKHCVFYYKDDFDVADMRTVRAAKASKNGGTIYQDEYRPKIAIPATLIRGQNSGLVSECVWTHFAGGFSMTDGPYAFVTPAGGSAFHEIVTDMEEPSATTGGSGQPTAL